MVLGVISNSAIPLVPGFKVMVFEPVKSPVMAIVLEAVVPPLLVATTDTVMVRPNCIRCGLIEKLLKTMFAGGGGGGGRGGGGGVFC